MSPTTYSLIILWIIIFYMYYQKKKRKKTISALHMIRKKKKKENFIMIEFIHEFLEKECVIYTIDEKTITGTILSVSENSNAILINTPKNNKQIINLDYVSRIREYPINPKTGKKENYISD